jgi:hypothetical protein
MWLIVSSFNLGSSQYPAAVTRTREGRTTWTSGDQRPFWLPGLWPRLKPVAITSEECVQRSERV